MTMTATIGRSKSYYHTIMTMTATIGRSKSYYHTIMTIVMVMIVKFTSISDRCHGHDCMTGGFISTYDRCHGIDCMIVRFTSTYDSCHGIDCNYHTIMTMTATIGIEVNPTFIQS
jgi:hypothetical protein